MSLQKIQKVFLQKRQIPSILLHLKIIEPSTVIEINNKLQDKQYKELDIILHTHGGDIESAYKIVKLLRKHAEKINIIVPLCAKSAGTLICLAADKLIMSTISELGPLDVQILEQQEGDVGKYKSALNGYKALQQAQNHALENLDSAIRLFMIRIGNRMKLQNIIKIAIDFSASTSGPLYEKIDPKSIEEYARDLNVSQQYGIKILTSHMGWEYEKANKVIHQMVYNYPSHSFIIDTAELAELGFKVESPDSETECLMNEAVDILNKESNKNIIVLDDNVDQEQKKIGKKVDKKNEK